METLSKLMCHERAKHRHSPMPLQSAYSQPQRSRRPDPAHILPTLPEQAADSFGFFFAFRRDTPDPPAAICRVTNPGNRTSPLHSASPTMESSPSGNNDCATTYIDAHGLSP
jgi:hypothetical protein